MDNELYRLLVDETCDALIATSPEGQVIFWNRGASDIFGYRADEAIGANLFDLVVPPELRDEELALMREATAGGVARRETVRRRKDGERVWVNISTRAVHENGQLKCLVTVKQDVTEQRALRDGRLVQDRYHDLFDAVPDAIVVANESGRILLFNRHAERLFGYRTSEVMGRPIELLLPERLRVAHRGHRKSFAAMPRTRSMGGGLELHGRRQDGSEFPVEVSLSPLASAEGGALVVSAIRDITERKAVELALQQKNVELELANQAKDRFLATMSHELRTPLNAVIGFTGVLLMRLPGPLLEEQERQLTLVEQSAMHLLALINDLLDLATIQSGGAELLFEECDLREVTLSLAAMFEPIAAAQGIRLTSTVPAAPCLWRTDRRAVRQVLINLLNNAVKFTPAGEVGIALESVGGGESGFEIAVTDTGIGIDANDFPRLFTAFSRVGESARRVDGTGLGLHLSQKLATLLHARIDVQSRLGQGSRFSIVLQA